MSEPRKAPEELAACDMAAALATLRANRLPTRSEAAMHSAVAAALDRASIEHLHEAAIDDHSRPDFLIRTNQHPDHLTAIEIKLRSSSDAAIMRQLIRYALTDRLGAIILVLGRHFTFRASALEGPGGRPVALHIVHPAL